MRFVSTLLCALTSMALASQSAAQNDECSGAIPVFGGTTVPFNTTTATNSSAAWTCNATAGSDIWYEIVSTTGGTISFNTCVANFDTVLEVYGGTCNSLVSLDCNDDGCGLQSRVAFLPVIGATYYVRIGGHQAQAGTGNLLVGEAPTPGPPIQVTIVDTIPGTWIDISGTGTPLSLNDDDEANIPTTVGNAALPAGVARVGSNGGARFGGFGIELAFRNEVIPDYRAFGGDRALLPFWEDIDTEFGMWGDIYWQEIGNTLIIQWDEVALYPGSATQDTATFQIQVHATGPAIAQFLYEDVSSTLAGGGGSASIGFQSGDINGYDDFQWSVNTAGSVANGDVLSIVTSAAPIGTPYCMANVNNTGFAASISGTGTARVSDNDLTLVASDMPQGSFGYFLTSSLQGFISMPGGSAGNLCLNGAVGRFVGPGEIQSSGNSNEISLLIDLTRLPSPTGFYAVTIGDVFNFQAWFRDSAMGVATSNFTNGIEVFFY